MPSPDPDLVDPATDPGRTAPHHPAIVSSGYDRALKLWDVANGQEVLTLLGHSGPIEGVAFGPDGQQIASAGDDRSVKWWTAR
jgi:WD40 repeat protein